MLTGQKLSLEFTTELVHNIAKSEFGVPAAKMKFFEGESTHHTRTNLGVGFNYHFNKYHAVRLRFMENEIAATVDRFLEYNYGPDGIGLDTTLNYKVNETFVSHSLSYIFSLEKNKFSFLIELGVTWNRLNSLGLFYHPNHTFNGFMGLGIEYRFSPLYSLVIGSRLSKSRHTLLYGNDYIPTNLSADLSFRYRIFR